MSQIAHALSLHRPLRPSRMTLVAAASAVAGAVAVTLVLALLSSGGAA